jgi:sulfite exporter TauE/SafE
MLALCVTIFLSSVFGSLHCAGMCGAFLAIAMTEPGSRGTWRLQALYHTGRLVSYAALGALAGALGSGLDFSGKLVGLQHVALTLAAAFLVFFGVAMLMVVLGRQRRWFRPPAALETLSRRVLTRAMEFPAARRAFAIGLATTLLPCGWLYAFVVTAAGTGSAVSGAIAMVVFWLGTLPLLVTFGASMRAVGGGYASRAPLLAPIVIIAVGVTTLLVRLDVPALTSTRASAFAAARQLIPWCHGN